MSTPPRSLREHRSAPLRRSHRDRDAAARRARARPTSFRRSDRRRADRFFASWLVVATSALSSIATVGSGRADDAVRITAESRIEVEIGRDGPSFRIRATLRDDAGLPLSARELTATLTPADRSLAPEPLRLRTDADGQASGSFTTATFDGSVEVRFEGDSFHAATVARASLEGQRAHVVLDVTLERGTRLSIDEPRHRLDVYATSAGGGAGLEVAVTNEMGHEVGRGWTDDRGHATLELPSDRLGPPSVGRLVVRTPGDGSRAAAQTEIPIVRCVKTTLRWLDVSREGTTATVRGELATSGGPVQNRAVGVFVNGEHAGSRVTDAAGRFELSIEATSEETVLEARFDSDAPWLESASAGPLRLAAAPVRVSSWIALASALFAAWLVVRGGRRRNEVRGVERVDHGIDQGTARGPASRFVVSGSVVDSATNQPLRDARARCSDIETKTSAEGTFAMSLPAGSHVLRIDHPGYEPSESRVFVPHRGEWTGLRARLQSRRRAAHVLLLETLAPWVNDERAACLTPRELVERARAAGAPLDLEALTKTVEAIAYDAPPPTDLEMVRLRSLLARGSVEDVR